MNIQVIAEHSIDMDLLPKKANILDAGSRGFEFANYFILQKHNVITIDADPDVVSSTDKHVNGCLIDFGSGASPFKIENDRQASHVSMCDMTNLWIKNYNLKSISEKFSVIVWDLIKLDIEQSEYEVIMSMDRPYTKQLSVEFHTHCGQTDKQVQECVDKLHSLGYKTIQHEKTRRHGLAPNWWDSLFILCD